MAKQPIHITPRGGHGWAVMRQGNDRASAVYPTQAQAEHAGRHVARRDQVEFLVHGRNGQIRQRDSYGHDPFPPKG